MTKEEMQKLIDKLQKEVVEKDDLIANQVNTIDEQKNKIKIQEDKIKTQEDNINKLEAEKKELHIQLEKLIAKYEDKVLVNRKIIADRFDKKSEIMPKGAEAINEVETVNKANKRKAPSEYFIDDLKMLKDRIEERVIDYDFEKNQVNRDTVKYLGSDESYKIEMEPVSFKIVKIIRPKYKDKDHIYQTLVDDAFPHSYLTPSLAANIIEMKYNLGIPLYRYSQYLKSGGLNLSVQDITNYALMAINKLETLYDELEKALVNTKFKVIHGDESPLEIIDSDKDKCYMFVYTTSFWDHAVYIYKFSESRKIDNTINLLNDFNGYYECDGYSGYDALPDKVNGEIKIQRCWIHMRRYFTDCLKSISEEKRKSSPAYKVVLKINEMFALEAKMRDELYTADQIKQFRNDEQYQKVITDIDKLITSIDCGNNSYLIKAVNHYKNDKEELYTFLENGYVDIGNNLAERTVKPFVIARKNFLFCKTASGGEATGKLFSIVQTSKANGLRSELYLKYILENIDKLPIDDLLPWSDKLPKELLI